MTQTEIHEYVAAILPPDLWERYIHLSFGEMADEPTLAKWSATLRQAERDWYEAEER